MMGENISEMVHTSVALSYDKQSNESLKGVYTLIPLALNAMEREKGKIRNQGNNVIYLLKELRLLKFRFWIKQKMFSWVRFLFHQPIN